MLQKRTKTKYRFISKEDGLTCHLDIDYSAFEDGTVGHFEIKGHEDFTQDNKNELFLQLYNNGRLWEIAFPTGEFFLPT